EVHLSLRSSELAVLDLYRAEPLQAMPDHWEMPAGFDQRDFFLVGGGGWATAVLPFEPTSPSVTGTPGYVHDRDSPTEPVEPDGGAGMPVYRSDGPGVGAVEAVEVDDATKRIPRITVRQGFLFGRETSIPASMIASVSDQITLRAKSAETKK